VRMKALSSTMSTRICGLVGPVFPDIPAIC